MDENRNCTTCNSEDKERTEWPCSRCDPRWLSEWTQKEEESELADIW